VSVELVRRSGWGAKAPRGRSTAIPTPVAYLFLHHSASPDGGPEVVRAIQRFHQDTRGWADIAYTWLYSPRDRVFYEGRGPGISGAHTKGYNHNGHAVCILGNYEASKLPTTAIDDLAEWATWHGETWGPGVYTPHRQVGATACPGKNVIAVLDTINDLASADPQPLPVEPDPADLDDDTIPDALLEEYRQSERNLSAWERIISNSDIQKHWRGV
jgi:peptidoglycan recognition protein